MKNACLAMLGIPLVLTLMFGGLIHATVPHAHGDEHHREAAIWTDLHGALTHTGKKFLFVVEDTLFLAVLGLVIAAVGARTYVLQFTEVRARDPVSGESLRRGLLAYRAFR